MGIGVGEVVEGSIIVEAMDLSAVVGFEEMKEFVEEVIDLDDRFIGDWRQADLDRVRIGSHEKFCRSARSAS